MQRIILTLTTAALCAACVPTEIAPRADSGPATDAGLGLDAQTSDGTLPDAQVPDAGAPDAQPGPDAGPPDTGISTADRDQDGIPDVEDPQPDTANPRLLEDHFDDVSRGWIFSSVSMAINTQGSLLQVEQIEPFERVGWVGPRPTWADYFVRSLVRVDRVGTSNDTRSGHAGIITRVGQVTPARYITCGVDLKQGRVVLAEHEGTRRLVLGEAPATPAAGQWLLLNFTALRNGFVCEIGGVRVEGASANIQFNAGSVGFRSYDATFAADWIEVYDLLP